VAYTPIIVGSTTKRRRRKNAPLIVGGTLGNSTAKKSGSDDIASENAKTIARIKALNLTKQDEGDVGDALKKVGKEGLSFIQRLGGVLNTGTVATTSLINNAVTDKDVNVFDEIGKSWRGESDMGVAKVLKNLGVKPKSALGKFALMGGGLVGDIALDPLTYLTMGYSGATKIAAIEKAADVFKGGVMTQELAESLSKHVPQVAEYVGRVFEANKATDALQALTHAQQADVFKAIVRETASELGDKGGLKVMAGFGKNRHAVGNIIKGSTVGDAVSALTPNTVRESAEGGLLATLKRSGAEAVSAVNRKPLEVLESGKLGAAAREVARDDLKVGNKFATARADRISREVFGNVDEDLRHVGTIAYQRLDTNAPARVAKLDELQKWWTKRDEAGSIVENASKHDQKAVERARQVLVDYKREEPLLRKQLTDMVEGEVFNAPAFRREVEKLAGSGKFTDDQLEAAEAGFKRYGDEMRSLRKADMAQNVAQRKMGNRGLYYVKGLDGTPNERLVAMLRKEADAGFDGAADIDPDLAAKLSSDIEGLDGIRSFDRPNTSGSAVPADQYKHKKYDTIEERLKAGAGAETDILKIMRNRIEASGKRASYTSFMDDMARQFGAEVEDGTKVHRADSGRVVTHSSGKQYILPDGVVEDVNRIKRIFESPQEVKIFANNFGKLTRTWKSQATATPGFFMRNMQSNYFLAHAHGFSDTAAWKEGITLANKLADGKPLTAAEKALAEVLERNGVRGGGQTIELADDVISKAEHLAGGGKLADLIHNANGRVEDSGRIAVFIQARARGMSESQARKMVDKVLYSYDKADLTAVEQGAKNIIPFYTWIRRNLPAQVEMMLKDPSRVSVWSKAQKSGEVATGENTDWRAMPKYMQDMGAIPIPLPNGKTAYFNPNFGWQDLGKLEVLEGLSKGDPTPLGDNLMQMLSPFIKTPIELAMDKDSYFKTPIKGFEGHRVKADTLPQLLQDALGDNPVWGGVKTAMGARTSQDGTLLVNPIGRKLATNVPMLSNVNRLVEPDEKQAGRLLSILAGMKVMPDQSEDWATNESYEERDQLQEILDMLRERGYDTKRPKKKSTKKKKRSGTKPLIVGGTE